MKNFSDKTKNIQNKIKNLQDEVKHKSSNFKKGRYPIKTIDNLNNKIKKNLNKLFQLSNKNLQEIKSNQTKKLLRDYNKIVRKYITPIEEINNQNKNIEKLIQEREKEILKTNEHIQKLTQKKIKVYNFIFTLYRDLGENDKFNKFSRREFKTDSVGNSYIIYKIEFGIQSTTNPLKLKNGEFYNINDSGSKFIKEFIEFLKDHMDNEEKFYINLDSYLTGVFVEMTIRDEIEYQPIDIENIQYKNDGEDIAIYNRFTKYTINDKAENFKDLIELEITNDYLKNNFKKNCCFLTAIINKFYKVFDE